MMVGYFGAGTWCFDGFGVVELRWEWGCQGVWKVVVVVASEAPVLY